MTKSRFWKNLHPLIRRKRKPIYEEDTNYAILNAIDKELEELEGETFKSRIQSSLKTATGFFLDEYGDFFGVFRRTDKENDEDYRDRIVEAIDIPRGTNNSIKRAIRSYLEDNTLGIEIYEPWEDIFYLNRPSSRLNGKHKMQGKYYHFAVIDIYIGSPFGEDIVSLINDYKPAGVTLFTTYDPSLGNIDGDLGEGWGAIPYVRTLAGDFENTLEMYTSLYQPLQGTISLSDAKTLNNIFDLNRSDLSGLDVLSGRYNVHNNRLHLVGTASEIEPNNSTLMKDMVLNTDNMDDEFYVGRDKQNNDQINVELRPTKQLYVTLNIDTYAELKYPNLDRFAGEYQELVKDSSVQVSFKTKRGVQLKLEVYDFKSFNWVDLDSNIATNRLEMFKARLDKDYKYLNDNQLMFLRVVAPIDVSVAIDHFRMDYKSSVREVELGYNIGGVTSHPIITTEEVTV